MLLNFIIIPPNCVQRIHLLQFFKDMSKLEAEFTNAVDAHNYLKYNKVVNYASSTVNIEGSRLPMS